MRNISEFEKLAKSDQQTLVGNPPKAETIRLRTNRRVRRKRALYSVSAAVPLLLVAIVATTALGRGTENKIAADGTPPLDKVTVTNPTAERPSAPVPVKAICGEKLPDGFNLFPGNTVESVVQTVADDGHLEVEAKSGTKILSLVWPDREPNEFQPDPTAIGTLGVGAEGDPVPGEPLLPVLIDFVYYGEAKIPGSGLEENPEQEPKFPETVAEIHDLELFVGECGNLAASGSEAGNLLEEIPIDLAGFALPPQTEERDATKMLEDLARSQPFVRNTASKVPASFPVGKCDAPEYPNVVDRPPASHFDNAQTAAENHISAKKSGRDWGGYTEYLVSDTVTVFADGEAGTFYRYIKVEKEPEGWTVTESEFAGC